MLKDIMICADDFAQNEAISEGIIQLADRSRINAIGCIVNFPFWQSYSQALHSLSSQTLIGLHFNLTFGHSLRDRKTFGRLPQLLLKTHCKTLNRVTVEQEFEAQLDAFSEHMNQLPDFIDGHQHVHQLPIIRDALLTVYQKRKLNCFFRHTSNGLHDLTTLSQFPKSQLISLLGGLAFKAQLKNHTIASNTSFSGIYNFSQASQYATYFKRFLTQTKTGGLIMCHPGLKSADKTDPQYKYRHHEFNYFMSDDFLRDLKDNSCQLVKVIRKK